MASSSPDADQTADVQTEQVTNVDDGVRIRSSICRGTGTRDEDDHTIEIERQSVDEALADLDKALTAFEEEYLQRIRNLDPERDDEDDSNN